nr:hypothetical protein [uncultured Cohaesibacter sp.]
MGRKAFSPSLAAVAILRHVAQARGEVAQVGLEPSGQVLEALSKSMVPPLAGKLFGGAVNASLKSICVCWSFRLKILAS